MIKKRKILFVKDVAIPRTDLIVAWQKRHKETQKPINIFRIMTDRITGKGTVFIKKGKDDKSRV